MESQEASSMSNLIHCHQMNTGRDSGQSNGKNAMTFLQAFESN